LQFEKCTIVSFAIVGYNFGNLTSHFTIEINES
jgi:hypothetical protein